MTATAHLIMFVDFTLDHPRWAGCGIYSEPTPTSAYFIQEILHASGESYAEARELIIRDLRASDHFSWLLRELRRTEAHRVSCTGCEHEDVDACDQDNVAPGGIEKPSCWTPDLVGGTERVDVASGSATQVHPGREYRMVVGGQLVSFFATTGGMLHLSTLDRGEEHADPKSELPTDNPPALKRGEVRKSEEKAEMLFALRRDIMAARETDAGRISRLDIFCNIFEELTGTRGPLQILDAHPLRTSLLEPIDEALRGVDALHDAACASWHPKRLLLLVGYRSGWVRTFEWHPEARYLEPLLATCDSVGEYIAQVAWREDGEGFGWLRGTMWRKHKPEETGKLLETRVLSADRKWVVAHNMTGMEISEWGFE